jgi:hypothetical protein
MFRLGGILGANWLVEFLIFDLAVDTAFLNVWRLPVGFVAMSVKFA